MARTHPRAASRPPEYYRAFAGRKLREDNWSSRSLRARCAGQRDVLHARGMADAALDAAWPGGADNPGPETLRNVGGWVKCYALYLAMLRESAAKDRTGASQSLLHETIAAAQRDKPAPVHCADGAVRYVYPKGDVALEVLDEIDGVVQAATRAVQRLGGAAPPGTRAVLRSLAVRVWLAIVTHEGADLPFTPATEATYEPPDWTLAYAPQDLLAFVDAFRGVNAARLAVMGAAFPKQPGAEGLSFATFTGTFAGSKGLDPLDVAHRWSRARVVAVALSEALTSDAARKQADAEAAQRQAAGGR
jgi:hypothetical protein